MYDARAIANTILLTARRQGVVLSNLKLQKLLYFVHGRYLVETGTPLVKGDFEAWQYGPVHPLVYSAFKDFGANDITGLAERLDPVRRMRTLIDPIGDALVERHVAMVVGSLGPLSAGQLVDLTHASGGPWSITVEQSQNNANIGLKIDNEIIRTHFAKLRVVAGGGSTLGENYGDLRENAPYTRD